MRLNSLHLATLCALGSLSLPQIASAATTFGSNLIVNGNAEADVGSSTGSSIGPVTGFTKSGDFTVIQYGASGGYPALTDPGPADRGANFFGGGYLTPSLGTQVIDISDVASAIDTGRASFDLSAYLGGYASQDDNAVLTASFLDTGFAALSSVSIGPVTAADRGSLTGLSFRDALGVVPVGTRSILIDILFTRVEGSSNDGYADDLSLVLAAPSVTAAVPEPQSWAMMFAGLGVVAALQRRRRTRH